MYFFTPQSLVTPYFLPALRIDVWSNNPDIWLIIQELINVKPEESRDYSWRWSIISDLMIISLFSCTVSSN